MTQLPDFTPALDDRLSAELLAHTLMLLAFPVAHDERWLDALAWRFERPEPPRDPDLPILAPKRYPRLDRGLIEATVRALQPPPPIEGFAGRRMELDQAVSALLNDHPLLIDGQDGSGKTALLRQIAADSRIRMRFRRVWWLEGTANLGDAVGLALELPGVLRRAPDDQPAAAREFLAAANVLLLIDQPADVPYALGFGPGVAVVGSGEAHDSVQITLGGLSETSAADLLSPTPDRALIELAEGNPRALKLMRALMIEDGLTPDLVAGLIQDRAQPLSDLYRTSFDALPQDYQALCGMFATSGAGSIWLRDVLARFSSPVIGQRALTFLERHGFIERRGDTVRAVGGWWRFLPVSPGDAFPLIPFPASAFRSADPDETDDQREQARDLYERGLAALDDHSEARDEEASVLLNQALQLRQQHDHAHAVAETLTALARLDALRGNDATAIRRLESAAEKLHELRDDESLNVVRVALSRAYRRAGRRDAALGVLNDESPAADRAAIYEARGEWEAALEAWAQEPDPDERRRGLAWALIGAGRLAEALEIVADSDDFEARWVRATVYHLQGDFEGAIQAYDRADRLAAPDSDRGRFARARARALAASGRIREAAILTGAEGIWYEAKQPRPAFARQRASQALYAALMAAQDNPSESVAAAMRALHCEGEQPDPEADAIAHHVLARLYAARGDSASAIVEYAAALEAREAAPQRNEAAIGLTLHALAEQYAAHGEPERAIPYYRRALTHFEERQARVITLLRLRDGLLRTGRDTDAIETGQQIIDLLSKRPEADLQTLGWVVASQTQMLIDSGRSARAIPVWNDWLVRLARRAGEAFESPAWGVQVVGIGLIMRSVQPGQSGYPLRLLIDLAEEAVNLTETHAPATPPTWAARRDLGNILLAAERWTEALEVFKPLLDHLDMIRAQNPLLASDAHAGAGQALFKSGQAEGAISHFDAAAALETDPLAAGRLIRQSAAARAAASNDEGAVDRYAEALSLIRREQALDEHVGTLVDLAYTRLRLGRFGPAIDTFDEALSIVQELPDPALMASVLTDLANAHHTLGQYRRAAATYHRALGYHKTPDKITEALIAYARSSAAYQAYPQALEAFHDALQYPLTNAQRRAVLTEQASIYAAMRRYSSAIETYQAALKTEGITSAESGVVQRELGRIYTILEQHDEARAHFEQVLAGGEDDQTGLTLLAIAEGHRTQGQTSLAIETFSRALEHLDRAAYPVERAAALRALGELADGLPNLEAALEIERALPKQDGGRIVRTLQSIAAVHELRGELDKATLRHHEALVYQDVRHAPELYAQTLRTLGRLYMQMQRYSEAGKAFEDALATEVSQPTSDPALVYESTKLLADVYRAQSRLEQAVELYRRVATPNALPINEQAAQALADTLDEIARHEATLDAAERSWALLKRTANSDLKSYLFVLALQAQAYAALGKPDESGRYLDQMMALLMARSSEVTISSRHPAIRTLAILVKGYGFEEKRDPDQAREAYRHALQVAEENKLAPALLWAIRQKIGRK